MCVCTCVRAHTCVQLVDRELWATAGFVQMVLPDPQKIRPTNRFTRLFEGQNTKLKFSRDFDRWSLQTHVVRTSCTAHDVTH